MKILKKGENRGKIRCEKEGKSKTCRMREGSQKNSRKENQKNIWTDPIRIRRGRIRGGFFRGKVASLSLSLSASHAHTRVWILRSIIRAISAELNIDINIKKILPILPQSFLHFQTSFLIGDAGGHRPASGNDDAGLASSNVVARDACAVLPPAGETPPGDAPFPQPACDGAPPLQRSARN